MIDVGPIKAALVQVPRVAEKTEIDLAFLALIQQKSKVRNVFERPLLRLFLRGWPREKFAAATSNTQMPASS